MVVGLISQIMITTCSQIHDPEISAEVRRAGNHLKDAFKAISLVAMPGPGKKVLLAAESKAMSINAKYPDLRVTGNGESLRQ